MRKIPLEQPPTDDPRLREWLSRMMVLINGSIDQVQDYETIYEIPTVVFNGMTRLFGAPVLPEVPTKGLYIFQDGEWHSLMTSTWDQEFIEDKQYLQGDIISVGGFIFRANKDTEENPTPVNVGDPYWLSRKGVSALPDSPIWDLFTVFTQATIIGQYHPALETGFIQQIRVSIPQSNPNFKYTFQIVHDGEFIDLGVYNGPAIGWININPPSFLSDRVAEISILCEISTISGAAANMLIQFINGHFASSTSKGFVDNPSDGIDIVPRLVDFTVGIDARFQEATTSLDWDVVSQSGGGSDPSETTFTPTTFTGPGTTGYVRDSVSASGRVLSDSGDFINIPAGDWNSITGKPATFPPSVHDHIHKLDSHSDVLASPPSDRDSLTYDILTDSWLGDLRNRAHLQPTQPLDAESSIGDLWVIQ